MINESSFLNLVKYDYYNLVDILLKEKNIDINNFTFWKYKKDYYKDMRLSLSWDIYAKNILREFFINYSDEDQRQKYIELIGEEVGDQLKLTEETIINFINYVHQKEIPLNTENAILLHYLSTKFEIEELTEFTKDYISSHHKELAIKIF